VPDQQLAHGALHANRLGLQSAGSRV